ncbi:hypothetical protein SDC9_37054 [bioreactor metagenome]|uniref:Uncharacterized protein n=1 Tax=bioreactor metagenome TaxID=1076179 RepID=A0A644VID0_9ZZZZ
MGLVWPRIVARIGRFVLFFAADTFLSRGLGRFIGAVGQDGNAKGRTRGAAFPGGSESGRGSVRRGVDGHARQVGADGAGRGHRVLADGDQRGGAEADDGGGQHDPVNGHGAVFFGADLAGEFEEFHVCLSWDLVFGCSAPWLPVSTLARRLAG